MNKKGFLLFELAVCCALFILLSFCILAPYSIFNRLVAKSEMYALCSSFNYNQQKAIVLQKDISIFFDFQKQTYIIEGNAHALHENIVFGVLSGVKGPPSAPTHIITNPITYKNDTVTFYKNGVISSGTVYLLDISYNIQYAITNAVGEISYLRLYQYEAGKWSIL